MELERTKKEKRRGRKLQKKVLISILGCLLLLTMFSSLPFVWTLKETTFSDLSNLKIEPPASLKDNLMAAASGRPPWTNPFPLYDDLTEHLTWTNGYWRIYYFGYWYEQNRQTIVLPDTRNGTNIAGNLSLIDIAYAGHHYLTFYFDWRMDLTSVTYIKFYQALTSGHTGRCFFAFFSFGETIDQPYWATINYSLPANGLFVRQELNISQRNNWEIDSQFDWTNVDGFMFGSETQNVQCAMWIDTPKFYSNYEDPLPVGERIDSAEGIGEFVDLIVGDIRTRMIVEMWHGNISGGFEYWLLKVYLEDFFYLNHTWTRIHPAYIKLDVILPFQAEEHPPSHYPQAGFVGSARTSTGLSYGGIGFSITSAEKYINYYSNYENGTFNVQWNVEPSHILGSTSGCLFYDYCEFAIGFRTPVGIKPWAFVATEVKFYTPAMPFEWWPDWSYINTERVDWLYVDPPGSEPITPGAMSPMPQTPDTLYWVGVNQMQIKNFDGAVIVNLQRRVPIGILWINYTWWMPNRTQYCLDVRIYDSKGNEIAVMMMKMWKAEGYLPQYQTLWGFGLYIPGSAETGEAKIVVRILNDWPLIDDSEYSRTEMNITIEA